jgi:uncharacterized protein (DUF3820 family)
MKKGNPFSKEPKQKLPKTKRVWQTWDAFPFGTHKGTVLAELAVKFPDHLLWWQRNRKVLFSETLKQLINKSKFLAQ